MDVFLVEYTALCQVFGRDSLNHASLQGVGLFLCLEGIYLFLGMTNKPKCQSSFYLVTRM